MTYLSDGTYVVIPDLQCPYENAALVSKVLAFTREIKPDGILCTGDEADAPEISRWERGRAGEYAGTFEKGLIHTHNVVRSFSEVAPMHVVRSNHTSTRIKNYLGQYAPALATLSVLQYDKLMGYGQESALTGVALDVTWHPEIWRFSPDWALAHGDEGSLSRVPGATALNLAKRLGVSVLAGHTHRAGLMHHTTGLNGKVTGRLYGLECGHLMSEAKVGYLKTGMADWSPAFGVLHIEKKQVYPTLVLINKQGNFSYEGKVY